MGVQYSNENIDWLLVIYIRFMNEVDKIEFDVEVFLEMIDSEYNRIQ